MSVNKCWRCGKPVYKDIYCQDCEKIIVEEEAVKSKKIKYGVLIFILISSYLVYSNMTTIMGRE